LINFKSFVTNF